MTQTPQTPPGWYSQGDHERWWDGQQWSDNIRPVSTHPTGYTSPTPYAPQKSDLARNLLIVFGLLFLLCGGGCVAFVVVANDRIDRIVNDDSPGGPNNPITIVEGEAFEVRGFEYAAGWSVGTSATGDPEFADAEPSPGAEGAFVTIEDLTLTNRRGKADFALVVVEFLDGDRLVASVNCDYANGRIPKDRTVELDCYSSDTPPASYSEITIRDVF